MEENKDLSAKQEDIEHDHPPEKISDTQINQSEISSSGERKTAATEIINASQEKEMEVHPHTHPGHHKKTRKDYFWEFLMLFLAITLGFFVENQREHYIEHQREKKFSQQLLADLRADSVSLTRVIKSMQTGVENHEKFTKLMTSATPASNREIVKACIDLYHIYAAPANNATYTQMKSSGSLRYIQNSELTIQLQKYYELSRTYIKGWEEIENDFYKTFIQTYTINHFMMTDIDFLNDTLINQNPVFLNRTRETEMQLVNIMATYESYIRVHLEKGIIPAANKVNIIIGMLKKDYDLK